jgi:hypothetical protein
MFALRGAIPVLIVVTVAAAGCGGSSSSSSSVSSADYVAGAERICNTVNGQIAALPKIKTVQDLLTTGPKEVQLARQGVAKLKALPAPEAKKAAVSQYVATLEQETTLSGKLIAAFEARDATALRHIEAQSRVAQAQAHTRARALGLTACARQVQPSG